MQKEKSGVDMPDLTTWSSLLHEQFATQRFWRIRAAMKPLYIASVAEEIQRRCQTLVQQIRCHEQTIKHQRRQIQDLHALVLNLAASLQQNGDRFVDAGRAAEAASHAILQRTSSDL